MKAARVALAAVILCACAKSGDKAADSSASGSSAADTTNGAAAIAKVRGAWADGAHNKDAPGVAAMYTEDAVLVGSDQPLVSGRAAIQAALAKEFPISHGLQINSENSDVSGDLGYDFGTFAQEVEAGGKTSVMGGAYLVVLKRQHDGSWKIVRHVTTTPPKG